MGDTCRPDVSTRLYSEISHLPTDYDPNRVIIIFNAGTAPSSGLRPVIGWLVSPSLLLTLMDGLLQISLNHVFLCLLDTPNKVKSI